MIERTDARVMQVLAVIMAVMLAAGSRVIDTLGAILNVDMTTHWQPNEIFFGLVKDRETVSAVLDEGIGTAAANSYLTQTGIKKKATIRKALSGDGRTKVYDDRGQSKAVSNQHAMAWASSPTKTGAKPPPGVRKLVV